MKKLKTISLVIITLTLLGSISYANSKLPDNVIKVKTNDKANEVNITNNSDWAIDVYTIYAIDGTMISTGIISNQQQSINISDLESGIYFLTLYTKNQELLTKKIVLK